MPDDCVDRMGDRAGAASGAMRDAAPADSPAELACGTACIAFSSACTSVASAAVTLASATPSPATRIVLNFNDRLVDVVEGGFDAVIRSGALCDSRLTLCRCGSFTFVLCASPSYLMRAGAPHTLRELDAHACVRHRFPTMGKLQPWDETTVDQQAPDPSDSLTSRSSLNPPATLTCNSMEALCGAVLADLGIGYMPDFLARDALATGALVRVLGDASDCVGPIFDLVAIDPAHVAAAARLHRFRLRAALQAGVIDDGIQSMFHRDSSVADAFGSPNEGPSTENVVPNRSWRAQAVR